MYLPSLKAERRAQGILLRGLDRALEIMSPQNEASIRMDDPRKRLAEVQRVAEKTNLKP